MKRIFLLFAISLFGMSILSQNLKVGTGLGITSVNADNYNLTLKNVLSPQLLIGVDYWEHKLWNISSELTFLRKGIYEKNIVYRESADEQGKTGLKEHWAVVQLSNCFVLKIPNKNNNFILGAGPTIDMVIGDLKQNRIITNDLERFNLSLRTEVGYNFEPKERLGIGFKYAYNFPLTHSGRFFGNYPFNTGLSLFSIMLNYSVK